MRLQTQVVQLTGKLRSSETLIQEYQKKAYDFRTQSSNLKSELRNLSELIQKPDALKQQLKVRIIGVHTRKSQVLRFAVTYQRVKCIIPHGIRVFA